MKYAIALIDKAGKNVGSFYKLAAICGLNEANISSIRSGKRPLPLDAVPVIAELAGVDVDEAIHAVMIEQTKDPEKRRRLMEILGKAVAAGVAGMLVFSYNGGLTSDTETKAQSSDEFTNLYIVEYLKGCFFRLLSHFRRARDARRLTWGTAPYPRIVAFPFAIRSGILPKSFCPQ